MTQELERQIQHFEASNLKLRLQLKVGKESDIVEEHDIVKEVDEISNLLDNANEIPNKILEFKNKFADYGRDRRSAIEFHLRNIYRL